MVVVNITASPQVLAKRLVARGRESEADILRRLQRQALDIPDAADATTIDNSGPLDIAGSRLVASLPSCRERCRRSAAPRIEHDAR